MQWGHRGTAFAAEVCPLVTFTAIGEDAVAALTPVRGGADLKVVSLFLAVGGGGVGHVSLGNVGRNRINRRL